MDYSLASHVTMLIVRFVLLQEQQQNQQQPPADRLAGFGPLDPMVPPPQQGQGFIDVRLQHPMLFVFLCLQAGESRPICLALCATCCCNKSQHLPGF